MSFKTTNLSEIKISPPTNKEGSVLLAVLAIKTFDLNPERTELLLQSRETLDWSRKKSPSAIWLCGSAVNPGLLFLRQLHFQFAADDILFALFHRIHDAFGNLASQLAVISQLKGCIRK